MATPNMNLSLPTVSVTVGPDWANDINTAIETIDEHDHSSGKGSRITPSGLDINTSLDLANNILFNFKTAKFQEQPSTLSGASYLNAVYAYNGDLYFTNGSGTTIQLTTGGSIVTSPSSASNFEMTSVASSLTIGASDTYVTLIVDTTVSRTITLPLASSVTPGRIYIIKDASGLSETNSLTIDIQGGDTIDGASSVTLGSNYHAWTVTGDGVSKWYLL